MNRDVLVLDDDSQFRFVLTEALMTKGYNVVPASSAEEALDILSKRGINVMFLDLNLPGISGVDLCRRVRETNPIAWLAAVTGQTSLFQLADCREAGFDDYFPKPVTLELILKAAEAAFARLERWGRPQ